MNLEDVTRQILEFLAEHPGEYTASALLRALEEAGLPSETVSDALTQAVDEGALDLDDTFVVKSPKTREYA